MTVTNTELINSLKVLEQFCREHEHCSGCPIYGNCCIELDHSLANMAGTFRNDLQNKIAKKEIDA